MAALLAATAVGLLPLARPGAVAVGVGVLALLPLGPLPFLRTHVMCWISKPA